MGNFLAALAGAIVGAIASFYGTRLQAREDRTRRRTAIASGLLYELDSLEVQLRRMAGSETAGADSFIPREVALAAFVNHIELFRPETIHRVMHLRGMIQDLKDAMPGEGDDWESLERPHRTWVMRSFSGVMVLAVHDARRELLAEGGEAHPLKAKRDFRQLKEPELPKLPQPPEYLWDPLREREE